MGKWHNKTIDGQHLTCQIELDKSRIPKKYTPGFPRRGAPTNDSASNSRRSSLSRKEDDTDDDSTDDEEAGPPRPTPSPTEGKSKNDFLFFFFYISTLIVDSLTTTNVLTQSFRTASLVQNKNDPSNRATLIEYVATKEDVYRKELEALKLLEGMNKFFEFLEYRTIFFAC